jgi:hypothetical protein
MKFSVIFQACLAVGAGLAAVGGVALAACSLVDPDMEVLRRVESAYRSGVHGFLYLAAFAVAWAVVEALGRTGRPLSVPEPAAPASSPAPEAPEPRLPALYHGMKTYIDLEMWELALEKANAVVKEFPGTREAELVSKNLAELRWKAEPKFVAQTAPLSADQERELREKGLAAMYNHVKTYMDLEMWELARQKALALLKGFPESPEAAELMKVYESLERKAGAGRAPEPAANA